jgi:hypothetical protein
MIILGKNNAVPKTKKTDDGKVPIALVPILCLRQVRQGAGVKEK